MGQNLKQRFHICEVLREPGITQHEDPNPNFDLNLKSKGEKNWSCHLLEYNRQLSSIIVKFRVLHFNSTGNQFYPIIKSIQIQHHSKVYSIWPTSIRLNITNINNFNIAIYPGTRRSHANTTTFSRSYGTTVKLNTCRLISFKMLLADRICP